MLDYVVVDVFCDVALEGNPVAVVTDAAALDATTMQRLAREFNLSETVFTLGPAGDTVAVRIFTPYAELPFAGHPVLGTAFVIGERTGADVVTLRTGSGPVPVTLRREAGRIVFGEMDQPIPTWEPIADERRLLDALGVPRSRLPVEVYDNGPRHVYVVLGSADEVVALAPDLGALAALGPFGVSCLAVNGETVRTRMFAPALGVAEDPATGSAAGPLAVHLGRHGAVRFGTRIEISQGREIARPSQLIAQADHDGDHLTRVAVGGGAVIVAEGRYRIA